MTTKIYNAYRLTHKNGIVEDVNALDLVQALENMEIPETESRVLQAFLVKEGVRTLMEDEPKEIIFSAIVAEGGTGSIATPASGKIHAGDMIQLKAIPARNYAFVSWSLNGTVISNEATLNFIMPELKGGLDTAVFTATFALAPVEWTTSVTPSEASGAGALAFPLSGVSVANSTLSLIAVEAEGYTFDHWERNGETLSTNKILNTEVTPLAEGEKTCTYVAVFTAN